MQHWHWNWHIAYYILNNVHTRLSSGFVHSAEWELHIRWTQRAIVGLNLAGRGWEQEEYDRPTSQRGHETGQWQFRINLTFTSLLIRARVTFASPDSLIKLLLLLLCGHFYLKTLIYGSLAMTPSIDRIWMAAVVDGGWIPIRLLVLPTNCCQFVGNLLRCPKLSTLRWMGNKFPETLKQRIFCGYFGKPTWNLGVSAVVQLKFIIFLEIYVHPIYSGLLAPISPRPLSVFGCGGSSLWPFLIINDSLSLFLCVATTTVFY